MKRWYLCPIIGSGSEEDPYRMKVDGLVPRYEAGPIPHDPVTGAPLNDWGIALATADDFTAVDADPDCHQLANENLAERVPRVRAAALKAQMTARGVRSDDVSEAMTGRDIVRRIGRHLDPSFDETKVRG